MAKIYLICPVRNASKDQMEGMKMYIEKLEAQGNEVHFPPRDVDQRNDDGGLRIVRAHRRAMFHSDEVHVWWDNLSSGSHFDLGMAFAFDYARKIAGRGPIRFVIANHVTKLQEKSFQNVLVAMANETSRYFERPAGENHSSD